MIEKFLKAFDKDINVAAGKAHREDRADRIVKLIEDAYNDAEQVTVGRRQEDRWQGGQGADQEPRRPNRKPGVVTWQTP